MSDHSQGNRFRRDVVLPGEVRPDTIQSTGYALIAVTSIVVLARYVALVRRFSDLKAEDYLLSVAYVFFVALTVLYIIISPVIFRLARLRAGLIKPYPTVEQDGRQLQIFYFVTTSSLWLCLWMVKFSLLSMYKRFLTGKVYIVAWWTITTFCTLVRSSALSGRHANNPVPDRLHPLLVVLLL
jgi:uncharacterized membrane protein